MIVSLGQEVAVVESVKAASDIYAPLSGKRIAINEDLVDAPELANEDPTGQSGSLNWNWQTNHS